MNEKSFEALLQELIDENPFAVRAILKILEVRFTESVETLAVTCEETPSLLVNLSFIGKHCRTDEQIKAVLCHEFLHVLLQHTETIGPLTPSRHIAFDAIINAIIHREHGPDYSSMMAEYYKNETGLRKLLRPMNTSEDDWYAEKYYASNLLPQWAHAWRALYDGELVADDIEALAQQLSNSSGGNGSGDDPGPFTLKKDQIINDGGLLGNHRELGDKLEGDLRDGIEQAMKEMNGAGIWRAPKSVGVGANPYEALFTEEDEPMTRWRRKTLQVLKQHLQPDPQSRNRTDEPHQYQIPVLSPGDRRAFLRSMWSPFLPDATWNTTVPKKEGTAQIYLDVSGSMNAEMPLIIGLLRLLSRYIQRPFWAFSDEVAPAIITRGQLQTTTSGGTSMACVLRHVAETCPASAVVVTDGYIEQLDPRLIATISGTKFHAIITRDGNPSGLHRVGIPYTQLDEVPA
jgi:hypothetical protein